MKLSTINLIVQSLVDEAKEAKTIQQWEDRIRIANEAAIYLNTALLCENEDIDKAMEYFKGPHYEYEYKEWLTSVVKEEK